MTPLSLSLWMIFHSRTLGKKQLYLTNCSVTALFIEQWTSLALSAHVSTMPSTGSDPNIRTLAYWSTLPHAILIINLKSKALQERKRKKKKSCLTINLVHLEFKNKVFIYLFFFFMEQKTCQEPLFLQVRTKIHRSVCKKTSLRYRHNVTLFPFPQFLTNMWLTTPSFLLIHKHPLS